MKTYEEISQEQDSFLDDNCNGTIPLRCIPELTRKIFIESVNWEEVGKMFWDINTSSSDLDLWDGFSEMLWQSSIYIDTDYEERWKWFIIYDQDNQMYWKLRKPPMDSVIMDAWCEWVLFKNFS